MYSRCVGCRSGCILRCGSGSITGLRSRGVYTVAGSVVEGGRGLVENRSCGGMMDGMHRSGVDWCSVVHSGGVVDGSTGVMDTAVVSLLLPVVQVNLGDGDSVTGDQGVAEIQIFN